MPEGRQSPSPEESSGKQQQSAPSSGQGVNTNSNNKEESKKQLEVCLRATAFAPAGKMGSECVVTAVQDLSSNPAGPLDEHLKDTVKKTETPDVK